MRFGYIAGTSNCGSTLLAFLLNAQPSVVSVGEVSWVIPQTGAGNYKCSCGASLATCPFWLDVSGEMERRGHVFDADHWNTAFKVSQNAIFQKVAVASLPTNFADDLRDSIVREIPPWSKRLKTVGTRNASLVDSILAITGASVFVDASKTPARIKMLRSYSGLEPYIIHLLRDSPAFVKSYIRRDPKKFLSGIDWWKRTLGQMERLKAATPPDHWLLVRYEDLCKAPEVELKRILQFLGVPNSTVALNFRNTPHHIIGNRRMRLADSAQISLDTSWRQELTEAQINRVMTQTAEYRRRFGYDVGEGR